MPATLPQHRRWFRFSLRTFLVAVALLCIWLGFIVNAARKQHAAVAAIGALDGNVEYDFEFPNGQFSSGGIHGRPRPKLDWLSKVLGIDYFHSPILVAAWGQEDSKRDFSALLPQVRQLSRLHYLGMNFGTLRDDDLQAFADLKELELLSVAGNQITGEGFGHLANLNHLTSLVLQDNPITDQGLATIAALQPVTVLGLDHTNVTDAGLSSLKTMLNLQSLTLEGTSVTDASIETLLELRSLTHLDVSDTKMTRDGIARLRQLRPKWEIHSTDGQN